MHLPYKEIIKQAGLFWDISNDKQDIERDKFRISYQLSIYMSISNIENIKQYG